MRKILVAILSIIYLSCTKSAAIEKDLEAPQVRINYPTGVTTLPAGLPLCMSFSIIDNKSLSSVWLEVNGTTREYFPVTRSIDIIEKYTAPVGTTGDLTATLYARDESGNESSSVIRFTVNQ